MAEAETHGIPSNVGSVENAWLVVSLVLGRKK